MKNPYNTIAIWFFHFSLPLFRTLPIAYKFSNNKSEKVFLLLHLLIITDETTFSSFCDEKYFVTKDKIYSIKDH
jgi:hypothetical protein